MFQRILIACDGRPESEAALREGVDPDWLSFTRSLRPVSIPIFRSIPRCVM